MKVLVAGGAGFVGSHLCEALLAAGHQVSCLDDLSTGRHTNIAPLEAHPHFHLTVANVREAPQVDVDVVLHLASPASPVDYDQRPLETLAANSLGTWRLLEIAQQSGARVIYASTSEIYGDPLVHPQPETYWGNVDPIGPRSCYDEGKRFGEALLTSFRRVHGVPATIVRLFNTYGPRMRRDDGRVIPALVGSALSGRPLEVYGDGLQTRSFCYISDLVDGLVRIAQDPAADGAVLNLGNPEEVTILQLAETIRSAIDPGLSIVHGADRPGDPERRRPVIDRVRERYGWEPRVGLVDGLRLTIEAFRNDSMSGVPAGR
jgi:nucleoside-diphosphate-sugar epimerase